MIQQSPTERAREVLAKIMNRHASQVLFHDSKLAEEAWAALASQAAQPAEADGVERIMRRCGQVLDYDHPDADSPEAHLAFALTALRDVRELARALHLAATPKAPATDAGEGLPAGAPGLDVDGICNDHGVFGCKLCLATPPAPNDDLRAALTKIATAAPNHCVCCTMMGQTARAALSGESKA